MASLAPHRGALSQGLLGRLVSNHLNGSPIQSMLSKITPSEEYKKQLQTMKEEQPKGAIEPSPPSLLSDQQYFP